MLLLETAHTPARPAVSQRELRVLLLIFDGQRDESETEMERHTGWLVVLCSCAAVHRV